MLVLVATAAVAGLAGLATATAAAASCAASPQPSPYAFTGTVLETSHDDRLATVRTDDGETVQVAGSDQLGSAFTSVDRTYEVGARYEFHPLNDASPYQDNLCTGTHVISAAGSGADGTAAAASSSSESTLPYLAPGFGAVGGALIAAIAAWVTSRRRRRAQPQS